MKKLKSVKGSTKPRVTVFSNEDGAIDLASVMVGIIVIGLIGGIIAATIFTAIPWAQDAAAKQQLQSAVQAENGYYGLSSDPSASALPTGYTPNSYTDSTGLQGASLLHTGPSYCVVALNGGKNYQVYSQSSSGTIWTVTDTSQTPTSYTGTLPSACQFITAAANGGVAPAGYVDPTPTITKLTYNCAATTNGSLPMQQLKGTETWSDGTTNTYATATSASISKSLTAGVTYQVTFNGTYSVFSSSGSPWASCLRSVDYWGAGTGVFNAVSAFAGATNLTSVPAHIPTSIIYMDQMFANASNFNDPNISNWDVSNVTSMSAMFSGASKFNQPLNNWNMSKVTNINSMFASAGAFNQPLDKWDVSNVKTMSGTFNSASAFNQPLNTWNVSNVTSMSYLFGSARAFNQPLNNWNVSNVTNMDHAFYFTAAFKQDISSWNVSNVTTMSSMFYFSGFNQPLNNWNVSNVKDMSSMFRSSSYNQPLNNWNTAKVTNMSYMFNGNSAMYQDIHTWNTAGVTSGTAFIATGYPTAWLPANVSTY